MNITNETTTERQLNQQRPGRYTATSSDYPPRPYVHEDKLAEQTLVIERKTFTIRRCANARGELVRITEDCGGKYNSIIVPMTGMAEFLKALALVTGGKVEVKVKNAEVRNAPDFTPSTSVSSGTVP